MRIVMDNTILSCTNFNSQLIQSIMPASNGSTHAARFTDKVAIVTGGSSGMGREASLALAKGEPLCLDFLDWRTGLNEFLAFAEGAKVVVADMRPDALRNM